MSDRGHALDNDTMKFGMLMESAQAHQKLAETHLERLRAHTEDLDAVVRDEIRRTLIEELQVLAAETQRTAETLRRIGRGSALRGVACCVAAAILCTGIPIAVIHWTLPSDAEIAQLRARRNQMAASIETLQRQGGRIAWRHCGETARLCVRVDRKAPVYGEKADYLVVAGY